MLSLQSARNAATERMRTERKNNKTRSMVNTDLKDGKALGNHDTKDEGGTTRRNNCVPGGTSRRTMRRKHVAYFRIYPEADEIEKLNSCKKETIGSGEVERQQPAKKCTAIEPLPRQGSSPQLVS